MLLDDLLPSRQPIASAHGSVAQVAATLGRGRGVCSHAVEGGGLVGIGFCFTGAVRFTALHFPPTFDERPFVGPGLECSVLRGAREFVLIEVLITVLHAFDEFTVTGYAIASDIEKLGAGAGFHFVSANVAFNSRTVDLFDRIGVPRLVADGNALLT
jgi:hypothetical protein